MLDALNGEKKGLDGFRSPVRVLASFFQESRDKWKHKCMDLKTELKRLKVRVHDVSKSRDAWREKAVARERELESLQSQLQQLQAQLSEVSAEPQKMAIRPAAHSSLCQTINR